MRISAFFAALLVAALLNGCAEAPGRTETEPSSPQGLKFSYPTATRNVITLTVPEREFMLNEMRYYLDMLWVASDALSRDDYTTVAKVARSRVPAMSSSPLPGTLEAKLPREFLSLWRAGHMQLDELAATAETTRSNSQTMRQVSALLKHCNDCHALFQFQSR